MIASFFFSFEFIHYMHVLLSCVALSIVEELPLPLPANGFLALAHFLMNLAETSEMVSSALCALAALIVQVETNFKIDHYRSTFKTFLVSAISQQNALTPLGRAAIYEFMKGLVVINSSYAVGLFEDGPLSLAFAEMKNLSKYDSFSDGDENVLVAFMGFIHSMLMFGDDVECALYFRGLLDSDNYDVNRVNRIRPSQLLPLRVLNFPDAFKAVVEVCTLLYGSRLIDDAEEPESMKTFFLEDHVEYIEFVDSAMRAVLELLEQYDGEIMVKACHVIILLSRHSKGILGVDCNGPIVNTPKEGASVITTVVENKSHHRLSLTDIIASCRGLLVEYFLDDLDNFELDNTCVADAIAVLSGWSFNCWDPLSSSRRQAPALNDDEVKDVVAAITSKINEKRVPAEGGILVERPSTFATSTAADMVSPELHPDDICMEDPDILDLIAEEKHVSIRTSASLNYNIDDSDQGTTETALDALQDVLCEVSDVTTAPDMLNMVVTDGTNISPQKSEGATLASSDTDRGGTSVVEQSSSMKKSISVDTDLVLSSENIPLERQISQLVTETSSRSLMEKVLERKDAFLEWELDSTEVLCRNLILVLSVSRSVGCSWILKVYKRDTILELISELLTDERHGLNTYPLMEEKCIQLFADLLCADPSDCGGSALLVYEHVVSILSDWNNFRMSSLVETCISSLIVLATVNNTVKRRVITILEKINVAILRTGKDRLLEFSLALVAVSGIKNLSCLLY